MTDVGGMDTKTEVMQNPDGFGLTETGTELPSATILMMQVGP